MTGIEITAGDWLLVTLAGAVLGLDGISWPQAMWSRPIAAGTIGGLLFGAPAQGFLAGAWLEILTSRHPPFGAARYPEAGPSALVAGAAYALSDTRSLAALLGALWVGWTLSWIGTHGITVLRRVNKRLVGETADRRGEPFEIVGRHRFALRLDAARGAALTGALFVPSVLAVRLIETLEPGPLGSTLATALTITALAGLTGVGARTLGTRRERWMPLVGGAALGVALLWVTA